MTEDTIVIDGKEYGIMDGYPSEWGPRENGHMLVVLRPKRKQTGWICRECFRDNPCVFILGAPYSKLEPYPFLRDMNCDHDWQRFYGKVVE